MDFGDAGAKLLIVLVILIFLAFNIFIIIFIILIRRYRGERTPLERVLSLLSEINHNQKLVEDFQFHLRVKKFKTGSWKRNKTKVDFLDQSLLTTLDTAFSMAEGFNQDIDAAKKHKSTSYLAVISIDKLKELLAQSKQGLEEWLQENAEKPQFSRRQG